MYPLILWCANIHFVTSVSAVVKSTVTGCSSTFTPAEGDPESEDSLKTQNAENLLYGDSQTRAMGESGKFEKQKPERRTEVEKEIELLPEAGKQKSGTQVKADDEDTLPTATTATQDVKETVQEEQRARERQQSKDKETEKAIEV